MDVVFHLIEEWRAELPEAATLELEIVKRVGRLKLMIEEATARALADSGLTYADFDVLLTLRRAGDPYRLKPSQLAARSMLTTGGTSNILQRLTAAGLVTREPDPDDGRGSWVRLTSAGIERSGELALASNAAHAQLLEKVPRERLQALSDLLQDVMVALGDTVKR